MRKRVSMLLGVLLLVLAFLQPLAEAKRPVAPPAPAADGGGDFSIMGTTSGAKGNVGDIYYGATPPNVDYNKPVLVFVHGYNSSAHTWWEETAYHGVNDMYTYAYNNGYRTAFVNLAPDLSMWYNGDLLNRLIDTIRSRFGVSKVTIIAHSKGGVDANSAAVHYGAAGKISRIVTLGSPHWGTPLSDMAFSSWTWWLAELFGQANEATYVLQTGYMEYFRSVTDGRISTPPYYTLSGYKCGPVFSAMWYGCMAIGGEDDGVVPVWSTRIPGGTHLKEGYWDHDEIKMGSRTWSYFSPYIRTASLNQAVALEGARLAAAPGAVPDTGFSSASRPSAPGNVILRGGATGQAGAPGFPVESGVRSASFTLIATHPDFVATLTGPDGATYSAATTQQVPAGQIFAGAYTTTVTVEAPAAGLWSVDASAPGTAGWLMVAGLDSDLSASLSLAEAVTTPGGRQELTVAFGPGKAPATSQASAAISLAGQQPHSQSTLAPGAAGKLRAALKVPGGPNGIHNVTVTVTGTLEDGSAYERTLVSSFAAVAPGDRGRWQGR